VIGRLNCDSTEGSLVAPAPRRPGRKEEGARAVPGKGRALVFSPVAAALAPQDKKDRELYWAGRCKETFIVFEPKEGLGVGRESVPKILQVGPGAARRRCRPASPPSPRPPR
jgi:hypothetical protein